MYRLILIAVLSVYANLGWGSVEMTRAVHEATQEALRIPDVTKDRWEAFLKDWMADPRHDAIRSAKKWAKIRENLLASFDNWRANKVAAGLEVLDDDTRAGFEGASAPVTSSGEDLTEGGDWDDDAAAPD